MRDRLFEQGVVLRNIPATPWLRASCGWWTSEDDVERLARACSDVRNPSSPAIGCNAATTFRMWSSSSMPSSSAPL